MKDDMMNTMNVFFHVLLGICKKEIKHSLRNHGIINAIRFTEKNCSEFLKMHGLFRL